MSAKELNKLKDKDVRRFTLEGMKTEAKVLSIHDGATCDLAFYRNEELVRFNCCLEDVKAPELDKPKNNELARDYLAHLCRGEDPDTFDDSRARNKKDLQKELDKSENLVYAVFGKPDKYERFLVTLKTAHKGKSINNMMKTFIGKLE